MPNEKTPKERALEALDTIVYQKKFNAFRVMKNGTHEIRHSSTLAWLLDKREKSHSFGYQFALKFFSKAVLEDKVAKDQWKKWLQGDYTVETEVSVDPKFFTKPTVSEKAPEDESTKDENTKSSASKKPDYKKYIDILIVGEGFTCTIENKFGSSHHDHQCAIYKAYIDETYKGYQNYYIYLDIYRQKFDEIDSKDKDGYDWLGYDGVLDILKQLVEKEKTNLQSETKDFLLQYIDILNERYGNYNEEVKRALDEVTADSRLAKDVFTFPNAELSRRRQDAKKIVCGRINAIQDENDKFILEQLQQLVKEEFRIIKEKQKSQKKGEEENKDEKKYFIEYHDGSASVNDPYGYKLNISDAQDSIGIDLSALKTFMNQIDYTSKFGIYSIRILCGLGVIQSRGWVRYAAKNAGIFYPYLKALADNGWKIKSELCVYHGLNTTGTPQHECNIPCRIMLSRLNRKKRREILIQNLKKLPQLKLDKSCKIKRHDYDVLAIKCAIKALNKNTKNKGGAKYKDIIAQLKSTTFSEECAFYAFISDLLGKRSDEYQKMRSHITEQKQSINLMCFPYTLTLEYQCNEKPLSLRSNEERAAFAKTLAEIYREKTIEGLNLFQSEAGDPLGDDFAEKIFNSLT